jgi:hypothetical protein
MNRNQFIKNIENTYKQGVELIKTKNSDYASDEDPWRNFGFATLIGLDVKQAILLRTVDKIARISNLLKQEAKVKDETITDTLLDAVNYLAILKAKIEDEQSKH